MTSKERPEGLVFYGPKRTHRAHDDNLKLHKW